MAENLEIIVVVLDWDYDTFAICYDNDNRECYYLYDISMEYSPGEYPDRVYLHGWPSPGEQLDMELAELISNDEPIYRIMK